MNGLQSTRIPQVRQLSPALTENFPYYPPTVVFSVPCFLYQPASATHGTAFTPFPFQLVTVTCYPPILHQNFLITAFQIL